MPRRAPVRRLGRPPTVDLDAILQAAEQVGLEHLTATAVAARLGVSEGTVRHHAGGADRLYALACARVFDRLDIEIPAATAWRPYLAELCGRIAALVRAHPGIESYLVHGPYTDGTMARFEALTEQIRARSPNLTVEGAWLLGSRALILTASVLAVRSTRYPPGVEPAARHGTLFAWMLDAYLTGAETLLERGDVPHLAPTTEQDWARLDRPPAAPVTPAASSAPAHGAPGGRGAPSAGD